MWAHCARARAESYRRGIPGGPRCPAPGPEGRDAGRELGAGLDAAQDRGHRAITWTPRRDAGLRPDGRRPDDQAGEPLPRKRGDLPAHPSGRGDRLRHRVRRAARAAGRHIDHHAAHRRRLGVVGGAAVAPDARTLAVLGTGVQARAHAEAMVRVRPIQQIRVAGRDRDRAGSLASALQATLGVEALATDTYGEACADADLVCATTHSPVPVVDRTFLTAGSPRDVSRIQHRRSRS